MNPTDQQPNPPSTTALALRSELPSGSDLPSVVAPFSGIESFEAAQRMANLLCNSNLVPETYRGKENMGNCLVALEISSRLRASPLMVMQHMAVIEGRPAFSSQFLIGTVNSSRRFTPIRYSYRDLGKKEVDAEIWEGPRGQRVKKQIKLTIHDKGCRAWAIERATNERLEGPEVTLELAVREGWYTRNGSKWKTMPDLMLTYRAAAFFCRLFAPEMSLGMGTVEERIDAPGAIDVEVLPAETPLSPTEAAEPTVGGLPRRATRAPRSPVLPAVEPPVDIAPQEPAPAPPAPPTTPLPARRGPGRPPREQAAPPAPPAPASAPVPDNSPRSQVARWVEENGVTLDEVNNIINDYSGGENVESLDKLTDEQVGFMLANQQALTDAVKGTRL